MQFPTRFSTLRDLCQLPWFDAYDDRVVVSDRSVGPIIDVHTHVALAYVRPMAIDLYAEHERTEIYLPSCCPLDLDVYSNRNFPAGDLNRMKRDLSLGSISAGGMRRTHTVPNLRREMTELGIERSVVLPIDFPVLSHNWEHAAEAGKRDEHVIAFGSVHPFSLDLAKRFDEQLAQGVRGLKVHPAVQLVRPDHPRAMELYRLAAQRRVPILWHCGPVDIPGNSDARTQVRFYEKPIAENPDTTFILGHAGALQYEEAIHLATRYSNVYVETSSQGLTAVKRLIEACHPDRIMLGSDWPFYSAALPIAKVLIATHDRPELRHKILYSNAVRLLGLHE